MPDIPSITETLLVASNDHWRFFVGRMGERWVGFAAESAFSQRVRHAFAAEGLEPQPSMICFLSGVCERGPGCVELGVRDRDTAIRLTGAVAQDPESAYGGADHWHVPEGLRADPEDFRCEQCGAIGCDGECADGWDGLMDTEEMM